MAVGATRGGAAAAWSKARARFACGSPAGSSPVGSVGSTSEAASGAWCCICSARALARSRLTTPGHHPMGPTSSWGAAATCPAAQSLKAAGVAKSGAVRNRSGNRRGPGPQPSGAGAPDVARQDGGLSSPLARPLRSTEARAGE
eukprot:361196-Chlamydomonas_euryale.AAC.9